MNTDDNHINEIELLFSQIKQLSDIDTNTARKISKRTFNENIFEQKTTKNHGSINKEAKLFIQVLIAKKLQPSYQFVNNWETVFYLL